MGPRSAAAVLFIVLLAGGEARPQERTESLEDVFARVRTSVVTLLTSKGAGPTDAEGAAQPQGSLGSGVLLEGGRILTAAHVVHLADTVVVVYADGTRVPGDVIGSVVQGDVALLRVDGAPPRGVQPAVLADSDGVRVGSRCFVVGAPKGLGQTLTVGHVSARRGRDHPTLDLLDTEEFQTDAAVNQGNSGGPMFDMQGRVIGIVSYKKADAEGLGFAVTSNAAKRHLLDRSPIWSGMTEVFLAGRVARAFQIPEGRSGFLVQRVAKGSPADRLGIRGGSIPATIGNTQLLLGGDILLEAMGTRLDSPATGLAVMGALKDLTPASRVTAVVLRSGATVKLEATAGDLAPWLAKPAPKPGGRAREGR